MNKQRTLPTYEVEFIPLERRLEERRKEPDPTYSGPERRKDPSRRDREEASPKPLRLVQE